MTTSAYIALGSNIGDGADRLRVAVRALNDNAVRVVEKSSMWRTEPVDMDEDADWFTNAVVACETSLSARQLLRIMQRVERMLGRPAHHGTNLPRTLDLDLILFGAEEISSDALVLPHPRALQRLFVLLPLSEIAPGLCWPGSTRTVEDAIAQAPDLAIEKLPATLWLAG